MCVAFFTLDHPGYALCVVFFREIWCRGVHFGISILCSNRDEHLSRPAEPARFHSFGGQVDIDVLSGIDLQAGGTWLGLSRTGKLGLL